MTTLPYEIIDEKNTKKVKTYEKGFLEKVSLVREKTDFPKEKITNSESAANFARKFYHEDIEIYESVFMLLMSRSNKTLGYVKISQGGVAGSVVDVKLVAKYALDSLCSSVILFHNHPSGNTEPSEADNLVTAKVKNALKFLDIRLMDHIILTPENGYFSYADNGRL